MNEFERAMDAYVHDAKERIVAYLDATFDAFMWGAGFYGDPVVKVTLVPSETDEPAYLEEPSSADERDAAIAARRPPEFHGLAALVGEPLPPAGPPRARP